MQYSTKQIIVHGKDILRFVYYENIYYCKSDNCYTSLFLNTGDELVVCKSLKKISQDLDPAVFIRVNQSYLINKNFIKLIDKKKKHIELLCGMRIPFTTTINQLLCLIQGNLIDALENPDPQLAISVPSDFEDNVTNEKSFI